MNHSNDPYSVNYGQMPLNNSPFPPQRNRYLGVEEEKKLKKKEFVYLWCNLNLQSFCLLLWEYIQYAFVIAFTIYLEITGTQSFLNIYSLSFIALFLANFCSFILFFKVRKIKFRTLLFNDPARLKKFLNIWTILGVFVLVFGLNGLLGIVSNLLSQIIPGGENSTSTFVYDPNSSFMDKIFYVVTGVIIAPIGEEIVYRGGLLMPLRRYGDGFAIFFSGFLFGLAHGNLRQVPGAMFMGFFWGYIACKTNSILPGMILHFLNNLMVIVYEIAQSNVNIASEVGGSAAISSGYVIFLNLFSLVSLGAVIVVILILLYRMIVKNPYIFKMNYHLENLYRVREKYMPKRLLAVIVSPVFLYVFYKSVMAFISSFNK